MRPICSNCARQMKPAKNGRIVELIGDFGPYQLWAGDEYRCESCGATVVTGFGFKPISEHWKADYAAKVKEWPERIEVRE